MINNRRLNTGDFIARSKNEKEKTENDLEEQNVDEKNSKIIEDFLVEQLKHTRIICH